MYCKHCGRNLEDDAIACTGCGRATKDTKREWRVLPVLILFALTALFPVVGIAAGIYGITQAKNRFTGAMLLISGLVTWFIWGLL